MRRCGGAKVRRCEGAEVRQVLAHASAASRLPRGKPLHPPSRLRCHGGHAPATSRLCRYGGQAPAPSHLHRRTLHRRTLHPRTLAPSHPRTLAPSHLRTLAPSHPRTLAPSHPRTLAPRPLGGCYDCQMRAVAVLVGISLSVQVPTRAQSAPTWIAADQGTHIDVVARFTGSEWVPMPSAGPGRAVPRDWTRWYTLGASIPIRLSSTEPAGRCSAPKRLPIANPPSRTVGRADARYVGLAVSGPIQIEPMTRVTDTSPEWERIALAVAPVFERHARDNGVAPGTLDRVPLTIDWVYGIGRGSERATIYFEASKRPPAIDGRSRPLRGPASRVRPAPARGRSVFLLRRRVVDPVVQATALQRVVTSRVRLDVIITLGGWSARIVRLGDAHLEVRQELEQVRLELLVGAVDLVDQQDRRTSRPRSPGGAAAG